MKKNVLFIIFFSTILYLPSVSQVQQLRWAADAEGNVPYIFQDQLVEDRLIGFEVDIVNAICNYLNLQPVFVQNQWDGLIPGLYRGDYDIAINGIEITPDRTREVLFSKPYYITYEQLVVLADEDRINKLADLKGLKAGALKNSLAERILNAMPGVHVVSYEGEVNAFTDMVNGRIDAVLCDAPIAMYYTAWNPDLKVVGEPVGEVIYGIAMRLQDTALQNKINEALDYLIQSKKLREIYDRWNLWNLLMAVYINDYDPSMIEPVEYNRYVELQKEKPGFEELVERYIGIIPTIGKAAWMTLQISILSMLLAIILGLILAVMRVYAPKPLSLLAVIYIEFMRGTPLLIQLYFIFYAAPTIGIKLSPFLAAIIGLGLNYAAYEAENYRAGLNSVSRGQFEAAYALGMNRRQALRYIILPQAIRLVIPPITNDFISLLKDSSLVSVITMVELTKVYFQLATKYYDFIGMGIFVAIVYLLLGLPFVRISKLAENKFLIDKRKIPN